jgi:hypothetical protein
VLLACFPPPTALTWVYSGLLVVQAVTRVWIISIYGVLFSTLLVGSQTSTTSRSAGVGPSHTPRGFVESSLGF